MIIIEGKYNTAKVFVDEIEEGARLQIKTMLDQPFVENSKIRVMPDVHAGAGSTIGTTMTIRDKVVPNLVGVDIGCGMLTSKIKVRKIDFSTLDTVIRCKIPSGFSIRNKAHEYVKYVDVNKLKIRRNGKNDKKLNIKRAERSIGTLGGGNHFIEINQDENNDLYLVIHTGSRNIGNQVASLYQREAMKMTPHQPKSLAYLEGEKYSDYLHDMKIMQEYAVYNRLAIRDIIVESMGWEIIDEFTTIHNYVDLKNMILRKGAVSAQKGEKILIPLNMRDGSLIAIGKGNPDWNYSAPHGAGRVLSRTEAKRVLSLENFKKSMSQVYSTSINKQTIDESPEAYKDKSIVTDNIHDSAEIIAHLKPLYNFKG
ncbi:MAG: RtcB family protein [Clostridiaceae bacterium]|jgi:RNA-splicing ligase RtcB|nr:RtcB family protein [Clostridiaceae bacterium]